MDLCLSQCKFLFLGSCLGLSFGVGGMGVGFAVLGAGGLGVGMLVKALFDSLGAVLGQVTLDTKESCGREK